MGKCLASIRKQTIGSIEIIVLDSMSTDKSKEIALEYQAIIIQIPEGTFNHGLTRNIGAQKATGDFLFFTVQDAWLSENDLLEKMVMHFDNEQVMAIAGHQAVPHDKDKNPVRWFRRFSEPEVIKRNVKDFEQFKKSSQAHQQSLIAWDDVVAMYRRTALIQQPFVSTQFAEDWIWSRDALKKGWTLIYDPSIVVYHYHHSDYRYSYKLAFVVNYHFLKFFDFKPGVPGLIVPMLRVIYHLMKHSDLTFKEKLYWIRYNFINKVGTFNSHVNFLLHVNLGGVESLEKRYNKVCKLIPLGKQRTKSL